MSEYKDAPGKLYYGLDLGFAEPAAVIKVRFERAEKKIYVLDEVYEAGMVNSELAPKAKELAGRAPVTCDCAEAKSIEELRRLGVNAIGSRKGADSVLHGIQWLQGHQIIVDMQCQNMRNELTLYQWRKDKDGNSISAPVTKNDHLLDALRYALESEMESRPRSAPPKDYGNDRRSYWRGR